MIDAHWSLRHFMNSEIAILAIGFSTILSFTFINVGQSLMMFMQGFVSDLRRGRNVGMLETADILTAMIAMPFYGLLGDKIGRRNLLLLGSILMAASLLLYPFANAIYGTSCTSFARSFLLYRIIFAAGGSAVTCAASATIGDLTGYTRASSLASKYSMISGVGGFVGAVGLGNLPKLLGRLGARTSIICAFATNAVLVLASAMTALLLIPNKKGGTEVSRKLMPAKAMLSWHLLVSFQQSFAARIATILIPVFLAPTLLRLLNNQEDADKAFRIVSSLYHVMFLLAAPVWGIAGKRAGPNWPSAVSAAMACVAFLAACLLARSTILLGVLLCVAGVGSMGTVIMASAQLAEASNEATQAMSAAVFSFAGSLGILIVSQLSGSLLDTYPMIPFLSAGIVFLALMISCLSWTIWGSQRQRQQDSQENA